MLEQVNPIKEGLQGERLRDQGVAVKPAAIVSDRAEDEAITGALRQLEESLTRLQTDYVDEWRLHNVWGFEELDKCFAPDGAIQALIQAREEGLVRCIGISGHIDPQVQIEALRWFPFDGSWEGNIVL